jgi:mannose-1-phosphate guanylyltransferase / mannose-6-phosphate isomerase
MKVVILAGGGGTRLFPLSRVCYPKQFLNIDSDQSLLVTTVLRFRSMVKPSDIVIVTNKDYIHYVQDQMKGCGMKDVNILIEPVARNTAPAVALAARYCIDELGSCPSEVMLISPSDHIIRPVDVLADTMQEAQGLACENKIVTFGIKPTRPETGYGYIKAGDWYGCARIAEAFVEKPDEAAAQAYLTDGNYYWNSGMFAFTIEHFMGELQKYQPDIYALVSTSLSEMMEKFTDMPTISLDYAVAEKTQEVVNIPLDVYWNDIGSWDAIHEALNKDACGNAVRGDCIPLNCRNTLMLGESRLIAGIGVEDLIIVETTDVILVAKRGDSQKVKELVQLLNESGRKEASEHTTIYRPWGSYTIFGQGPSYKMKKIRVNPNEKLSLHLHYHRSEHWVVIAGTAKVTIGDREYMIHENESLFVPPSTKHRLENPGRIPLEIIEIQNGRYLEEDDIIRFDDIYGRS